MEPGVAALTREAEVDGERPSNGWLVLVGVVLPTMGFARIGRTRRGWQVLLALLPILGFLPYSPFALLALLLWWLVAVFGPLFTRSGMIPAGLWAQRLGRALFFVVVMGGVRIGYAEAFKIPAGSMFPTLEIGDHIYISKAELWSRGPRRGELVVFVYPVRPEQDFIKRVVGLPGDTIAVENSELIVNGSAVRPDGDSWECDYWDNDPSLGSTWEQVPARCRRETLDGHTYVVAEDGAPSPDFPRAGDPDPYVVPPGHYFVMGDNRSHSSDSRFWGPVPAKNLKGIARYVWYSTGPSGIRWERIGQALR